MTNQENIWSRENIKKIVAAVHHFSATDRDFRKLCLENPSKAVEKVAGVPVPSSMKLKFIESDPQADMTYLLPDFAGSDELDDNELAQVSGGRGEAIKDMVKVVVKPIDILAKEVGKIGKTGKVDAGIVCSTVGAVGTPPGSSLPAGTGGAAGAVSATIDSDYGQNP